MNNLTINDLYFSDVATKLDHARNLNDLHGVELKKDKRLGAQLEKLRELAMAMRAQMAGMAMFQRCSQCGSRPEGGCCSLYMANETDAIQLLINLLLGQNVVFQRDDGFECYFLGEQGCSLLCKPFFCLNYNCREILERAEAHELRALEKATGGLLQAQYSAEMLILKWLKQKITIQHM
ncbi:MAG: hypothetical protein U9R66_10680 [Thermodesulfobacteriota bacterium]|nr:hypothetical protein [Thermodesulfobacteriota bacterium]